MVCVFCRFASLCVVFGGGGLECLEVGKNVAFLSGACWLSVLVGGGFCIAWREVRHLMSRDLAPSGPAMCGDIGKGTWWMGEFLGQKWQKSSKTKDSKETVGI